MIDRNSKLIDVYRTAIGQDVVDRLLLEKALSNRWIMNPLIGNLKLKTLGKIMGDELIATLIKLVNAEQEFVRDEAGPIEKRWYKEAVFYQIYPRSFKDSNGDGIGDLRGILEKLDYIKALGVDALWLSPIYDSPNDDMGYDIRDYRKIMQEMGTMEDFEELLAACHARGLKLILDMVLNHSSDEHEWYQKALSGDQKYQDYYYFKEGSPEQAPNNWISFFSGPAWRYEKDLGKWALHLFSKKQLDLNWDNPELRQEIFAIVRGWLEKGVDGFRLDVINLISKAPGLPPGSEVIGQMLGFTGIEHYYYGPKLHRYLRELQAEALAPYQAFSVGETLGIGLQTAKLLTNEDRRELDLIFSFDHLEMPGKVRWDEYRYDLDNYKKYFIKAERTLSSKGWNALFFENHDNPRMLSKVNPDPQLRDILAKALCTLQLSLRGTPFIFQGQELGAANQNFTSMADLRDVESHNKYRDLMAKGKTEAQAWASILAGTRDHARTPLDWTATGGFSDAAEPWLPSHSVGDGHSVAEQLLNERSVLNYYKQILALRKQYTVLQYGDFKAIQAKKKQLFIYERALEGRTLLIEINLSEHKQKRSLSTAQCADLLISNYPAAEPGSKRLRPYEANIYLKRQDG